MLNQELLKQLKKYIDREYAEKNILCCSEISENIALDIGPTFNETLFKFIDNKNLKDSDVYKRAGISRSTFSYLRSKKDYQPQKQTAVALCIGCQLNLDETYTLLETAGYTLSNSCKEDIVVRFFITEKKWDINEINEYLFEEHLQLFPIN